MKKEDFLKLGLTEEQATKAAEASAEELKGFIPKSRFDEVNEVKKKLDEDIKTRDKQLEELKKIDAAGLQQKITDLQSENKTAKEKFEADLKKLQIDNAVEKATNIWNGLRYKVYGDFNMQISKLATSDGRNTFNVGFDARYYYPIFQNFIWAGRAAGDFSWGNRKILYYLGGQDGWLFPKANTDELPQDPTYAFQALAVNMRGFNQNIANGNNAVVLNSEFRFPVFTTLLKRPINNAFLRNFQLV